MYYNVILVASYIAVTLLGVFLLFPAIKKAIDYDYTLLFFALLLLIGSLYLSTFLL